MVKKIFHKFRLPEPVTISKSKHTKFKNSPRRNAGEHVVSFVSLCLSLLLLCCMAYTADAQDEFYLRGSFYQDWLGIKYQDSALYHRLSSRLKLTFWNKPGAGWTAQVDVRNRFNLSYGSENQLIIYDAHLSYDKLEKKLFFSLGQMNLYDTAGIGELTGGIIGYKLNKFLSLGGYAGLEPDIYNARLDTGYNKFGLFLRYIGPGAKQLSLSVNNIGFSGETERRFLYSNLLLPVKRLFVLYGNIEYELDNKTREQDRLSHLFLNTRIDITKYADITANYSSGKGLDYHRFLLEQSQNPTIRNSEVERYYYNETYGVRLSIKPVKNARLFAARRESELNDLDIINHTTQVGLSIYDILKSGVSFYWIYNMNRGDSSESDSYYISVSRNFGKLSFDLSFANYYHGVRFLADGAPEIFHYPDRKTVSTNLFYIFNRSLAFSVDYTYSYQEDYPEHQFFIRAIFRK